ncbi:MAG: LysR family transcriptional regulator [Xanthomonadaceae bacterium]|nr:LysR family transcriptional regulator [Xanthomonadaceae bacterium]
MNLDFGLLRCFKVVGEHQSISKASLTLNFSQPAISLQIKRLEQHLGKQLFERNNRGLTLTAFGEKMMSVANKAEELQIEMNTVVTSNDKPTGRVRVGTYTTASSYLLADPVNKYLKNYPNVTLSYSYDPVEVMLAKIKSKELDAAVLSDFNGDATLEAVPLWKDKMVFVAAPELYKKLPGKIKPHELSSIDFLSYPLRFDLCYRGIEKSFGKYLAKSNVVFESTSFDTLKQMLLLGTGATFMPHYLIKNEIKEKKLKVIEIEGAELPVEFSFISLGDHSASTATVALKTTILNWYKIRKS